jgi:glycine dehydrogenase subunit 1
MSGQLVARTRDSDGNAGFVNLGEPFVGASGSGVSAMPEFGLEAIAASVYLSLVGAEGLKRIAETCHDNTGALVARLTASEGVGRRFPSAFFHEAVIAFDNLSVADLLRSLAAHNVLGGYPLGRDYPELENCLLVCATEAHTQEDLDTYDRLVGRIVALQSRAPCPVQPKI